MLENLSIVIVTYNEENNIQDCIDSASQLTNKIFVVDSYSSDETLDIIKSNTHVEYDSYEYITYADKRNWAQKNNPFHTKWVMHLDADERVSNSMKKWFQQEFVNVSKRYDGVMFTRKPIFMGRFLKHGGMYPTYTTRLFKASRGNCEDKAYDQHFVVNGKIKVEKINIINNIAHSLDEFVHTHNVYSNFEASEIALKLTHKGDVSPKLFGNPVERRRWFKSKIFYKTPLFIRSILYFLYRYVFQLGFLDGKEGLIFFVIQTFWFRFLIDAKVYELEKKSKESGKTVQELIEKNGISFVKK